MNFGLSEKSISTIHKIFQKYQEIEQALIFGSRAKGNYKEGSDIDLTLIGKNLTTNDLLNIASDLEDSNLPYLFDLSIFANIDNENLREHINRIGSVFYERSKSK